LNLLIAIANPVSFAIRSEDSPFNPFFNADFRDRGPPPDDANMTERRQLISEISHDNEGVAGVSAYKATSQARQESREVLSPLTESLSTEGEGPSIALIGRIAADAESFSLFESDDSTLSRNIHRYVPQSGNNRDGKKHINLMELHSSKSILSFGESYILHI
jgi:hypothetical protein